MAERLADVIMRDERAATERRDRTAAAAAEVQRRRAEVLAEVGRLASTSQLEAFARELRGESS